MVVLILVLLPLAYESGRAAPSHVERFEPGARVFDA